jgi:hypothetical protein
VFTYTIDLIHLKGNPDYKSSAKYPANAHPELILPPDYGRQQGAHNETEFIEVFAAV